jgi:hypothetical protein
MLYSSFHARSCGIHTVQGGSDKSGILQIFFKNYTAQLKIIGFDQNKNT